MCPNDSRRTMSTMTPATLVKLFKHYFPLSLIDSIPLECNGCAKNICNGHVWCHADYYGNRAFTGLPFFSTGFEMERDLKLYISFPGSTAILGTEICEEDSKTLTLYKNLNEEFFFCRSDVFGCFSDAVTNVVPLMAESVPVALLGLFLWLQEQQLGGALEFIPYDYIVIQELRDRLAGVFQHFMANSEKYNRPSRGIQSEKFEDVLSKFKALIPGKWDSKKYKFFEQEVKTEYKQHNRNNLFIELCRTVFKRVSDVIEENKLNVPNARLPKTLKIPFAVRLFAEVEVKTTRFVMVEELHIALNGPAKKPRDPMANWETVDEKTAMEMIGDRKVEILVAQLMRTKLRSVPIRTLQGFCKPAGDVLFELIQDITLGLRIFQKIRKDQWSLVEEFVAKIEKHFSNEDTKPFFMTDKKIQMITELAKTHFAPLANVPAKEIPQEASNFVEIFQLFGPVEIFPDIENYTLPVYRETKNRKHTITRSDIFEITRNCVFVCFFKKFPQLSKFLHNQQMCHLLVFNDCCQPYGQCQCCTGEHEHMEEHCDIEENCDEESDEEECCRECGNREQPKESCEIAKIEKPQDSQDSQENQDPLEAKPEDTQRTDRKLKAKKAVIQQIKQMQELTKKKAPAPGTKEYELEECKKKIVEFEKMQKDYEKLKVQMAKMKQIEEQRKKESAACSKCIQSSQKSIEAQKAAKTAENQLKEREKDLRKSARELESVKSAAAEVEQQLKESQILVENLEGEYQLQNWKIKNLEKELAKLKASTQPKVTPEVREELIHLQDKLITIRNENPTGTARSLVEKIRGSKLDETFKQEADHDLRVFSLGVVQYTEALERNIETIQNPPPLSLDQLPLLPMLPKFPKKYREALKPNCNVRQRAADLTKCNICLEDIKLGKVFVECKPHSVKACEKCLNKWNEHNAGCPTCHK